MFQYSSKSLFSSVREEAKIGLFLAMVIAAFALKTAESMLLLFLFYCLLLLLSGYRDFKKLFLGLVPFLLIADIGFFLFLSDTSIDLVQLTISSNLRILSIFAATAFFTFSTDIFALLKLMKRLHFPEAIYLPTYVLFRFLPELEQDFLEIMAIQRLKGAKKRKPLLFLKSIMLPLLFTVLQKSDDLAIAYYLRRKREGRS